MIYFDASATYPMLDCVKMAIREAMEGEFGNASALHRPGHRAGEAIERAREAIAELVGARPGEILFTSGGSESNNTVIRSFAGKKVAVSSVEHPSVLEPARAVAKCYEIPVDEWGVVRLEDLPEAELYSVMAANNELGTVEPIGELVEIVREKYPGAYVHSDLTQALGKMKIEVRELGLDYATLSAHKLGGPIGTGALYVRDLDKKPSKYSKKADVSAPIVPLILGGHQERGLRAGTYATPMIVGFGVAAKWALEERSWERYEKEIRPLRDLLARRILAEIPHASLNTPLDNSLPHILNCSFEAAEGESIQLYLDLKGEIVVSTGSACAAGDTTPSHVIMATRNDAEVAHSSIRFSLTLEASEEDVEKVMETLPRIIGDLQAISTIKTREE